MAGGNRKPKDLSISCGFVFFLEIYFYWIKGIKPECCGELEKLRINICSPKKEKFDIACPKIGLHKKCKNE